jgi:ferrous iron transport protein A
MSLSEGMTGHVYEVIDMQVEASAMRRLEAMGMISGTQITILNRKKNGTTIFKVRGTRLAVGQNLAKGILVKEVSSDVG